MKFDFDKINDRRHTCSSKWNVADNELPLTIADMDFETCPEIKKAIIERAETGIYGYTEPDDDWYNAYVSFYKKRHDFFIEKDWLLFSTGVVPTISSSVRKLTKRGDCVVLTPPVYNIFYNSIVNNGRTPLEVPLLEDRGNYEINFAELEKAFSRENTSMFILCNPANPVGKIWSKDDLAEIGRLAKKYNVIVCSDEIHGEITRPGTSYTPFLSVNNLNKEVGFAAISVTKAFNLAGIQTSAIVVPNSNLRALINRQINTDEVAEGNVFSYLSASAALTKGEWWLDEMREYVFANRDFAETYIKRDIPVLKTVSADATYLLWIDIRDLTRDSGSFAEFLRKETGLLLSKGDVYGATGKGFLRLNLACPKSLLTNALERLKKGVGSFLETK